MLSDRSEQQDTTLALGIIQILFSQVPLHTLICYIHMFCSVSHTHTHTHTLQILLRNVHRNNQLSSCLELNINLPVSWYTHMQNWERSPERDFQSQKDIPQDTVRQTEKKSSKEKRKKNYLKKKIAVRKSHEFCFCFVNYLTMANLFTLENHQNSTKTHCFGRERICNQDRPCKSTFGSVC